MAFIYVQCDILLSELGIDHAFGGDEAYELYDGESNRGTRMLS